MSGATFRYVVVALLALAAIVVNFVDFPRVEAHTEPNWRALDIVGPHESPLDRVEPVRRRYGLFVAIAEAAPRAVVSGACRQHVPSIRQHLFGVAGVVRSQRDRRLDSDAILADLDLAPHVVYRQDSLIDAVVAVESFGAPGRHLLILCPTIGSLAEVVVIDAALVRDRLPEGW